MGKRDHGRLVHEVRDVLIRHGFKPNQLTQLETPEGRREVRTPGFKVEKHSDSKSVRLSYPMVVPPSTDSMSWISKQAMGRERMKRLVSYNETLEREGFTCIAIDSRNPLAPYSLWRRAHKG